MDIWELHRVAGRPEATRGRWKPRAKEMQSLAESPEVAKTHQIEEVADACNMSYTLATPRPNAVWAARDERGLALHC